MAPRRKIDTAAVKRVIKGIQALRRIAFRAAHGKEFGAPLPSEAFGMGIWQDFLTPPAKHFFFAITKGDDELTLEIDTYSAKHGHFHTAGEAFDVDAWDDGKLVITVAPIDRVSYEVLQRTARAFLNGRDSFLPNGVRLPGLNRQGVH